MELLLVSLGFFVGTAVGLTGVGGGAIMTPLLIIFTDLKLSVIIAVDLIFASVTKLSATYTHAKNDNIDWMVLKRMWIGSIPSVLAVIALVFTTDLFSMDFIMPVIGIILIISGILMGISHESQSLARGIRMKFPDQFKYYQKHLTVIGGSLIGSLVAMTSIGAGAIGAVMLRALYPLRMMPKKLVGTDTLHAIPIALIAGIGYASFGYLDIQTLLCLLLGSLPGSFLGATLTNKIKPHWVKVLLGIAILLSGIKIALY
ncbi:MAG: sulfite exporter TauE/SafE family protein [Gammaproteobacteria bacterium]